MTGLTPQSIFSQAVSYIAETSHRSSTCLKYRRIAELAEQFDPGRTLDQIDKAWVDDFTRYISSEQNPAILRSPQSSITRLVGYLEKEKLINLRVDRTLRQRRARFIRKVIRRARIAAGMTQMELAEAANMNKHSISDLECGWLTRIDAYLPTLMRVLNITEADISDEQQRIFEAQERVRGRSILKAVTEKIARENG